MKGIQEMKRNYKGFEINVRREKCLGGWPMLYFDIFRLSDGWHFVGNFEDSRETVKDKIKQCREMVDDYFENPQEYEDT
jgi:hypothetical protein